MSVPRAISLPVVLMIVAVVTAVAFLDYSIPHLEDYRQYALGRDHLPRAPIVIFVFRFCPFSWFLPIGAIGGAVDILRREACSARYLAWYACVFVTLCVFWTAISMFAVFGIDPIFTFGRMRPG